MDEMERVQHELHARLPAFQRKLDWTRQIIEDALTKMEHPYIAFSGGIDSTVLLDMLYTPGYRLPVLWGDDGFDFPETLQFLKDCEERYGFTLRRVRSLDPWRTWCEEMGCPDLGYDPESLAAWGNPRVWHHTWHTLTRDAGPRGGYGGVFLGMLAAESRTRGYALKGGNKPLYQVKSEGGMWHCSPLASWTKRDVWAHVVSRNLAYNGVYDRLAELGIPLEHRRVAALTCFRVMQYGSHQALKQGWPDLYNRLTALFPMVRAF